MQKSFKAGKTLDYKFRLQQLKNMRQGLEAMASQLSDARKQDLGTASFPNWMYELVLVSREVQHAIEHLSKWMSATSVD